MLANRRVAASDIGNAEGSFGRRLILVGALFLAALVPLLGSLSTRASSSLSATATATTPIQHVVVLYQENHTFDNVLGFWCDTQPVGRCDGMPSTVTLKGVASPLTPPMTPDLVPGVGHGVIPQAAAIDGGKMDGWPAVPGCGQATNYACVSGYEPSQIPNTITYANHFAISDRTFSMADSPSWGGHLYSVAASLDGFTGDIPQNSSTGATPGVGWGCDSNKDTNWQQPTGGLAKYPSCVPDPSLPVSQYPYGGAYRATPVAHIPTILDRLSAAALSWKIYTRGVSVAGGPGTNPAYNQAVCPTFADCRDTAAAQNMVPEASFLTDAKAGTLPNFALVVPGTTCSSIPGSSGMSGSGSQHNGESMACGDNWIGEVVSTLEAGPDWASTALFIAYDDCGCFYDHVPPGVNPDGTPQGPRIPLIIVSPYARSGFTDHTPTTFAGILAYVENNWSLQPLGANDSAAYAFGNAFNYAQQPLSSSPMVRASIPRASKAAPAFVDGTDPT